MPNRYSFEEDKSRRSSAAVQPSGAAQQSALTGALQGRAQQNAGQSASSLVNSALTGGTLSPTTGMSPVSVAGGPRTEAGPAGNTNRFTYDLDGDALYQQYRDRYIQNARRSMQDTMGQAASLTGGYGSTYGQAVGQQAYDETMRGLTDLIPQLEENAYGKWKDQQALTQQQYSNLSAAIMNTGYVPNADELEAAGMSAEQAEALRQAWIARNPGAAYMSGALSAENYFKLTGQAAPGTGGSGGGGGSGGSRDNTDWFALAKEGLAEGIANGGTREYLNTTIYQNPHLTDEQKRELISTNTAPIARQRVYDPRTKTFR